MHLLTVPTQGRPKRDQAGVSRNFYSDPDIQITIQTGGLEILEPWSAFWGELCDETPGAFPFARPEIAFAYVKAFAPESRFVLITAHHQGRLQAILPLVRQRAWFCGVPIRKLRGAANVHSAYFDMACAANGPQEACLSAMVKCLQSVPEWDLLEFPYVREGSLLERFAQNAEKEALMTGRWKAFETLFIPLAPERAEEERWFRETSKRFRSRLEKRRRKLQEEHALSLQCIDRPDQVALDRFYGVEASGWKGRAGTAILHDVAARNFYDELSKQAGISSHLRLYFLLAGGDVVAAQMGLVYGRRFYLLKAAYEERYRSSGPGHLLLYEVLRACTAQGLEEFDFVGPAAPDEAEWASGSRNCGFWYIFPDRMISRLLHGAKFKVAPILKRPFLKLREA